MVCNPGDDFDHLGLRICPDADTVLYTLAGLANPDTGWGRAGETWTFMQSLADLGGETWFQLGDGDLALHVERTRRLAGGEPWSRIAQDIARRLGVHARVAPACDEAVRTVVRTPGGRMAFQHYFVRDRCEPVATGFDFEGAENARPVQRRGGCARRRLAAVRGRVSVQPLHQHRPDPGGAGDERRDPRRRRAGDRCLADHRGRTR